MFKLIKIFILLIPFQIYFNFYKNLTISIASLLSISIFLIWAVQKIKQKKIRIFEAPIDIYLISFILIMLISISVSTAKPQSLKYFIKWSSFILIYFVVSRTANNTDSVKKLLFFGLIAGVVLSVISFVECTLGIDRVFKLISDNQKVFSMIMEPETLKEKIRTFDFNWFVWKTPFGLRAFSTFTCSVIFSAFLGLLLPFFITVFNPDYNYKRKTANIFMFSVIFIAFLLTFTASAYFAFLISSLIAFGLFFFILAKKQVIKYLLFFVFFIFILTFLMLKSDKNFYSSFNVRFSGITSYKFTQRLPLWKSAVDIFKAKPILGVGVANYHNGYLKYAKSSRSPLPAHNQYLQIAAELGILGLVPYLCILFIGIKTSYRIFRDSQDNDLKYLGLGFLGMWSLYCIQSLFNTYLFGEKYSMMFWLMVGLNMATYRIAFNDKRY